MAGWKRNAVGDLPVYQAVTLSWMPGIVQGISTRHGGTSSAPYDSLNLSMNVGDQSDKVEANRVRLLSDLGFSSNQAAYAAQVHGDSVVRVTQGSLEPVPDCDALITSTPDVLLTLLFADCVPIYVLDPVRRCIGLAHSGWRGTASNIAFKMMRALSDQFEAVPSRCIAAIGPSIGLDSYEVGADIAEQFRNYPGGNNSGAATAVVPKNEMGGKFLVNLRQIIFAQLLASGVRADSISVCDEDTFRNRKDFFSHRRDGGSTGRMAAYFALKG